MYSFVKIVDSENHKIAQKAFLELAEGSWNGKLELIVEAEVSRILSEKRIFFNKIGLARASQAGRAAFKKGYLELAEKDDPNEPNRFRVTHDKGLLLIDGFPFFRPGLWKAWYEEHGWLWPVVVALFAGGALHSLWHRLFG